MHHFRNTYPTNTNTIGGYLIPDDEDNNTLHLAEKNIAALQLTAPTNLSTVSIPYSYRFGFNGKEDDKETSYQDYGMRMYSPALARFISVDPITASYPMLTPYQFASNTPIMAIDLDGLEAYIVHQYRNSAGYISKITITTFKDIGTNTPIDMNITYNGTNYSGSNILVLDHSVDGNINDYSIDNFSRIQNSVKNEGVMTENLIDNLQIDNNYANNTDNVMVGKSEVRYSSAIEIERQFEYKINDKPLSKLDSYFTFISEECNRSTPLSAPNEVVKYCDEYEVRGSRKPQIQRALEAKGINDRKEVNRNVAGGNSKDGVNCIQYRIKKS